MGPIKWGIGRVIANAPKAPIVVPVFHLGLEHVMPQDEKNDIMGVIPLTGKRITVKVGDPVPVADLIDQYFVRAAARAAKREARRAAMKARGQALQPVARHPLAGERVGDEHESELEAEAPSGAAEPSWRKHHFSSTLRIKPPDHDLLTEDEALEEEATRLALYSAVCDRIGAALAGLEADVREYRREKGYDKEDRTMR